MYERATHVYERATHVYGRATHVYERRCVEGDTVTHAYARGRTRCAKWPIGILGFADFTSAKFRAMGGAK